MNGIQFSDGHHLTAMLDDKLAKLRQQAGLQHKLDHIMDQTKGSMTLWIGSFQTACHEEARWVSAFP